jgi:hypothetical protein
MSLTLVHSVILDGPDVRFEGSTEFTSDLQHYELNLFITVMQDEVVLAGKWTIPAGTKDWSVAVPMGEAALQPGAVTTTGLTVFQLDGPVSFETFTWTQHLEATRASEYTKAAPQLH